MAQEFYDLTEEILAGYIKDKAKLQQMFEVLRSNYNGGSFPNNPEIGQEAYVSGVLYVWNGTAWIVVATAAHNHNSDYYTKTEITDLLAGKYGVNDTVAAANYIDNIAYNGMQFGNTAPHQFTLRGGSTLGYAYVNYNNYGD